MEGMWVGVMCNCVYGNEEENGVIDNVEGGRPIYVSLVIKKLIEVYI